MSSLGIVRYPIGYVENYVKLPQFFERVAVHRYTREELELGDKYRRKKSYKLWKSGRSPKTYNCIRINGSTYNSYENFKIAEDIINAIDNAGSIGKYLIQTELINKGIQTDIDNFITKLKEEDAQMNKFISTLSWNQSVSYKGLEYGVPEWCDFVHRRDDCMGSATQFGETSTHIFLECDKCKISGMQIKT